MAAAILDRVLERGRFIRLDGPSGRTRHLNPEETLPENTKRLRISGIGGSDFPEPTSRQVGEDSRSFLAKIPRILGQNRDHARCDAQGVSELPVPPTKRLVDHHLGGDIIEFT